MRKPTRAIFIASIFVTGITAASTLYAQDNRGSSGSMMGRDGMNGGMMGGDGMMGMMNMMRQMGEMMETCNKMMQSMTPRHAPQEDKAPDKKG